MDRLKGKQSAAVDGLIISAVMEHGIIKPKAVLAFLSTKRQAKTLTKTAFYARFCRLRNEGRLSCPKTHRTTEQMEEWRQSLAAIVNSQSRQLGVRGVFYLAVAAGLCEKTESMYQAVVEALDTLRMDGTVDFDRIIDAGRKIYPHGLDEPVGALMTDHTDYDAIQSHIDSTVTVEAEEEPGIIAPRSPDFTQAREEVVLAHDLMWSDEAKADIDHGPWDGCKVVPFVICEKEGLSGIIQPICALYDVPFVAVRGGASITVLHQLWEIMQVGELPWRLLTLYDYDKAGEDIENAAMSRLRAFGGEAEWTSERIAVTPEQVDELELPMRPEKNGDGEAVELDAIPPDVLAEIVEKAIQSCIPEDIEERRRAAREEAEEKHYNTVSEMVTEATQEYEPQRNEEMQRYVQEQQPKFERLRQEFERDAPE